MILMVPLVLGSVFLFLSWMILCMLAASVGGLALRLCVGSLRRDAAFGERFPGLARRAAAAGIVGVEAGVASVVLFVVLMVTSNPFMVVGEICLWVCTLLCILCGWLLLRLAGRLRRAAEEGGASHGKRQLACKVCGVLTLLLSLPGVMLSVLLLSGRFVG